MSTKLWVLHEGDTEWKLYHSGTSESCFYDWQVIASGRAVTHKPVIGLRIEWQEAS